MLLTGTSWLCRLRFCVPGGRDPAEVLELLEANLLEEGCRHLMVLTSGALPVLEDLLRQRWGGGRNAWQALLAKVATGAPETLSAEHRGEFGSQGLDCDLAVMLQVLGEIDRGHPTATDLPFDGVAVGEGTPETLQQVGHDGPPRWPLLLR